jgi:Spy/CpxP family protein refolding chaperone
MNRPARLKVVAYVVALFLAGAIFGAMVMSKISAGSQTLTVNRSPEIAAKMQKKLSDRLALTGEQLQKIQPLIEKTAEELEASHRDCLKRISQAIDDLHSQLGPHLTPEQQPKLAALAAEKKELMWQKYHYRPEANVSGGH